MKTSIALGVFCGLVCNSAAWAESAPIASADSMLAQPRPSSLSVEAPAPIAPPVTPIPAPVPSTVTTTATDIAIGAAQLLPCPSSFDFVLRCEWQGRYVVPVIDLYHQPLALQLSADCRCEGGEKVSLGQVAFRPSYSYSPDGKFLDERSCQRSLSYDTARAQLLSDLRATLQVGSNGVFVYFPIVQRQPVCASSAPAPIPTAIP